jgi:hypothetical protein
MVEMMCVSLVALIYLAGIYLVLSVALYFAVYRRLLGILLAYVALVDLVVGAIAGVVSSARSRKRGSRCSS